MNFAEVRKIKNQREGQYPAKMDMFATFAEIGGMQIKDKWRDGLVVGQTSTCKCKLTDDMGEAHQVTLYVKQAITPNMLHVRAPFRLYAFDGTYGAANNPYVGYAGLWQDRAQGSPQSPQNAPQAANAQINQQQALAMLDKLVGFVASLGPIHQQPAPQQQYQPNSDWVGDDPPPPTDSDIPF